MYSTSLGCPRIRDVARPTLLMTIMIQLSSIPWQRLSLGHHRWLHNQFPPSFSVLPCPLGHGELQACPFPGVVVQPLPLSALSSLPPPPFTVPCRMVLARPDERMTWPYHCNLRLLKKKISWIEERSSGRVPWTWSRVLPSQQAGVVIASRSVHI